MQSVVWFETIMFFTQLSVYQSEYLVTNIIPKPLEDTPDYLTTLPELNTNFLIFNLCMTLATMFFLLFTSPITRSAACYISHISDRQGFLRVYQYSSSRSVSET
jgi:hypothetical protein